MTLDWLLGWWNLVFVVPFGLALLYLILYAASGVTFGDADADGDLAEPDVDHDVHLGHDAHLDHDLDVDPDADLDVEADVDADLDGDLDADVDGPEAPAGGTHAIEPGGFRSALTWLGVGRVPLSVLLMVLMLAWGATGFLVNQLARESVGSDWRVALLSLPAALAVGLFVTRGVVRAIDRWVPLDETSARRRHDLLGLAGVAVYDVTARFGMVGVRDDHGDLYQVPCRLAAGHADVIPKNATAVLVAYNARERLYHVVPPTAVGRTPDGEPTRELTSRQTG